MTATGNPALDAGEESLQDRELLVSLRAGEDAAFGELFSRHADAVRRLARSLSSDRADAEDLTAEAFFRVLQAIRRGSGPVDNVRSYLLIVTRRVAWEWSERRRDVPVADEVLTHRAGQNPDTAGQAHERSLIARAFTSLPERWRSVLWKVEVEGERPAVVATNFGLSPNATAALARRARRGLRAAYLQAHLSTHHGSIACRSILEKLGAYTAGTVKGAERRRVRAHLLTCSSCQSTHDELVDVCAGLRSYAGLMVAPVAIGGLWAQKAGFWATVKGVLSGAGAKLTVAATSVVAAGVVGVLAAPAGSDGPPQAGLDYPGSGGAELAITEAEPTHPDPVTGSIGSSVPTTVRQQQHDHGRPVADRQGGGVPAGQPAAGDLPATTASLIAEDRAIDHTEQPGNQVEEVTETGEETTILLGSPEPTKPSDPTCVTTPADTGTEKTPEQTPEDSQTATTPKKPSPTDTTPN